MLYPGGGSGTRTDSGHVYKLARQPGDHDIVQIIPKLGDDLDIGFLPSPDRHWTAFDVKVVHKKSGITITVPHNLMGKQSTNLDIALSIIRRVYNTEF